MFDDDFDARTPEAILRDALQQTREKLIIQDQLLQRLTSEPLRFATIISVKPPVVPAPVELETTPQPTKEKKRKAPKRTKKFVVGDIVRITRGEEEDETGRIIKLEKKYAEVRLDDSDVVEIVLAPDESDDDRAKLVNGTEARFDAKVKITAGRMRGHVGTITEPPDERNIAMIAFEDARCADCRMDDYDDCEHEYYLSLEPAMEVVTRAEDAPPLDAAVEAQAAPPPPSPLGTAIVLFDGKEIEVALPPDIDVKVGHTAKLSMQTLQIVDVIETKFAGEVVSVQRVLDEASSEVDFQSGTRAVYNGLFGGTLKAGDRVVLDPSGLVIIRNLGQEDKKDDLFVFTDKTNVTWSDIGGLADAKREMIEAIELPYKYGEFYSFYGKKPLKGLLLYGPPGCGKTMLGKAAATALAQIHEGKGAETCFMYVKAPEILSKFIGVAEATVRRLFAAARKHKEEHGYPAVIFIDEADAIMNKRGSGISSDIERTIVPMFLAEMDGFDESGAILILATNRADTLDPAIVREGRISRKIKVTRPEMNEAKDLFALKLKGIPLFNGYTPKKLAATAAASLFNRERVLYTAKLHDGTDRDFTFGQLCSGAMIAEIVDQATSLALHRDIAEGTPRGMRADDLAAAVDLAFKQNVDLNHDDDIESFVAAAGQPVQHVRRANAA